MVHRTFRRRQDTVSRVIEQDLRARGMKVEVLDGDVIRENLSKGLGFFQRRPRHEHPPHRLGV